MTPAKQARFLTTVIGSVFTQAIGMCLSLGWVFFVSRMLDVASAGRVFLGISVANTALAIFGFGLPHAFAVEGSKMGDRALASNALLATFSVGALASLAVLVVGLLVMDGEGYVVGGLRLLPLMTCVVYVNTLSVTTLRALGAFTSSNICTLMFLALFNIDLGLSWIRAGDLNTGQVLVMFVRAGAASCLVGVAFIFFRAGFSWASVDRSSLRRMFAFGAGIQTGNVFKEVMYRSSLYLVAGLLGPAAAGLYGLVLRIIDAVARFVDAVGLVIVPMIARGEEAERKVIAYAVSSVVIPIMVLAAIVVSVMSQWLVVALFGAQYVEAAEILRVGIFSIIPLAAWKLLANDFIGRGMVRQYVASSAIGAAAVVAFNLIFLRQFGIMAAPYALVASYLTSAAMLVCVALFALRYPPSELLFYAPRRLITRLRATMARARR